MDHRNLDTAMEIFAKLITGEDVSKSSNADLYEAYTGKAEVYDLLQTLLAKSNLKLCEYKNALYVTAGDQNHVFGFTNEELKRSIGLRLNRELYLAYLIIYNIMTIFYDTSAGAQDLAYVKTETVIQAVSASLSGIMSRMDNIVKTELEEKSFRSLALLWDELPLVTENEDLSTLKAARGSRTGFVKLTFNFLIAQGLFIETAGQYYITDRMRALVENYFDSCRGRLYELLSEGKEGEDAAY